LERRPRGFSRQGVLAGFKIHEGKLEEFKRLSAQCMEIVRTKDTGTLQYDIYFNDDQSECVVLERYRDSEALIEHVANLGDLMEAILATVSVRHGELLGEPSAELRAKLAGSEVPRLFTPTSRCSHRLLVPKAVPPRSGGARARGGRLGPTALSFGRGSLCGYLEIQPFCWWTTLMMFPSLSFGQNPRYGPISAMPRSSVFA
jgi:quinol monooxygenase YgiN